MKYVDLRSDTVTLPHKKCVMQFIMPKLVMMYTVKTRPSTV